MEALQAEPRQLVELANTGLIPVCNYLIASGLSDNISYGLMILKCLISGCSGYEEEMMKLMGKSIWLQSCMLQKVFVHHMVRVRTNFF